MIGLRNLRVIENFIDKEELAFWQGLLREPKAWTERHENYKGGEWMSDSGLVSNEPWHSAYQNLALKTCAALEDIYEEPLVIARNYAFRKYGVGDSIGLHYDYSRDGDGQVLQLHDETRREGEMAPYPAGLHDIQSVIYWNDDFQGGLVKFGQEDWIQPKAGMLITWPSTYRYGHQVSEITAGERFISAMFWIRAKTVAIATHTNLLTPHWRDYLLGSEKVDRMLGMNPRLLELFEGMTVPAERRDTTKIDNLFWLEKNLPLLNPASKDLDEAMLIVRFTIGQ